MQTKLIYAGLAVAGLCLGWSLTRPAHLRHLRWFQMLLLPIFLCAIFFAGSGWMEQTLNRVFACVLVCAAGAGLCLTLAANLHHFAREQLYHPVAAQRKPPLLNDIHVQPIRQLVAGEQFEEACAKLEQLLMHHRGDFSELFLMAQLYHQLDRKAEAAKCLLAMIPLARDEAEQLTAMKFYFQLSPAK